MTKQLKNKMSCVKKCNVRNTHNQVYFHKQSLSTEMLTITYIQGNGLVSSSAGILKRLPDKRTGNGKWVT